MNYEEIGLKCGLEVHQQLDTGKLYCRCPALLKEGDPDYVFKRRLRAVASELGEFDRAALEQTRKEHEFLYHAWHDCCCLVECDEEPPKPADPRALETVLMVSLMTKAHIFDELFVMRKTVVDGSNTSGFQRTMLVGENGVLDIGGKKVGILSIVLEEDSSRPLERGAEKVVYSLDRQGIPLIEIATAPELFSPEEARACAGKLGELLRLTCRARRGLGTIRQDINISIAKGARIELKGVQELGMVEEHVKREAQRQLGLVELMEELVKRRVKENDLSEGEVDVSSLLAKTECKFVSKALKEGRKAIALRLHGFAGLLGMELQADRRFGTEISDYLKARHAVKGLLHSDELPKYGVSAEETEAVAKKLGCGKMDAFVVVIEGEKKAKEAFCTVRERCVMALKGVPEETRNALENGNSAYSRPLPGAARMYPETDLETVEVSKADLNNLNKRLPLKVSERLALYKKKKLNEKLAGDMKLSNHACFFEFLLSEGFDATKSAALLLDGFKTLERDGINTRTVKEEDIVLVLDAERKGKLPRKSMIEAVKRIAVGVTAVDAIKSLKLDRLESNELERVVLEIVEGNSKMVEENGMRSVNALMGDAMKALKGKATGKEVMEELAKQIGKKVK